MDWNQNLMYNQKQNNSQQTYNPSSSNTSNNTSSSSYNPQTAQFLSQVKKIYIFYKIFLILFIIYKN